MKLLTHNFLACNIKGVKNGFPLIIEATEVHEREADLDPDFLQKMMGRIDYAALKQGAEQMRVAGLPDTWRLEYFDDPDMVQKLHHALLEVHLEEGFLVCPETGRKFPVKQGVPNMLLHEDEV